MLFIPFCPCPSLVHTVPPIGWADFVFEGLKLFQGFGFLFDLEVLDCEFQKGLIFLAFELFHLLDLLLFGLEVPAKLFKRSAHHVPNCGPFELLEAVGKRTHSVGIHDTFVKDEFVVLDFRFRADGFLLRVAYDFEGIPHWKAASFTQGTLKFRLHVVA